MKSNVIKIAMIAIVGVCVASQDLFAATSMDSSPISRRTTTTTVHKTTTSAPRKSTTTVKKVTPHRKEPARRPEVHRKPSRPVKVSHSNVVYKRPTPVVKATRYVPRNTVVVRNKGLNYHYHNGVYYRYNGGRYIVVPAPRGVRVRMLPVGYRMLQFFGRTYYYYQGTYYTRSGSYYEVVGAPQDIIVPTLPEEADLITMNGKRYYVYDGYIYSVVVTPNGKAFKMVGELDM